MYIRCGMFVDLHLVHLVALHITHRGLIKLNYSFKGKTNDTSLLNLIYAVIDKFGKFDTQIFHPKL